LYFQELAKSFDVEDRLKQRFQKLKDKNKATQVMLQGIMRFWTQMNEDGHIFMNRLGSRDGVDVNLLGMKL
jgi:hypothetical protein